MSDEEEELEIRDEESQKGEGDEEFNYLTLAVEPVIPKSMTFKEASSCLHMLGKDESGMRYAYLMITCIDRKLTEINVILQFVHVLFLDLAGNKLALEALNILEAMPYLLYLKVDQNIIESAALRPCSLLQILNFSRNKIMNTQDIKQPVMECLDLNYNFIENVEFTPETIPNIKLLELRGNLLFALKGIFPPSLDSLYLAQNRIQYVDQSSLCTLVNLRVLHLRDNIIHKLNGFTNHLEKLRYLNLRGNRITKIRQFRKLDTLRSLETLIVSSNPVCPGEEILGEGDAKEDEEEGEEEALDPIRIGILVLLPNLKRINKKIVSAHERISAELESTAKYVEIMEELSSLDGSEPGFPEEESENED